MLSITFLVNGRRVDPSNVGNAMEAAVLKSVQSAITEKLAAVRCPDHQEQPEVTARGQSLDKLSFEVKGCCQKLVDMATAQLT